MWHLLKPRALPLHAITAAWCRRCPETRQRPRAHAAQARPGSWGCPRTRPLPGLVSRPQSQGSGSLSFRGTEAPQWKRQASNFTSLERVGLYVDESPCTLSAYLRQVPFSVPTCVGPRRPRRIRKSSTACRSMVPPRLSLTAFAHSFRSQLSLTPSPGKGYPQSVPGS